MDAVGEKQYSFKLLSSIQNPFPFSGQNWTQSMASSYTSSEKPSPSPSHTELILESFVLLNVGHVISIALII